MEGGGRVLKRRYGFILCLKNRVETRWPVQVKTLSNRYILGSTNQQRIQLKTRREGIYRYSQRSALSQFKGGRGFACVSVGSINHLPPSPTVQLVSKIRTGICTQVNNGRSKHSFLNVSQHLIHHHLFLTTPTPSVTFDFLTDLFLPHYDRRKIDEANDFTTSDTRISVNLFFQQVQGEDVL